MLVYKMTIHNVKQYGPNSEILFPLEGLVGIIGKNGAGKSTLLEIISWIFYGKIRDTSNDEILNEQAHPKDECFAEIYFHFNGVDYLAKRHLTKTNECFIRTADGSPFAVGKSNVTEYISEVLFKMDYDAFISCYYAEQDDFDNLVKSTPAKRVQTFSKLLKIDAIDTALTNVRKEHTDLKNRIDSLRKVLHDENTLNNRKTILNIELIKAEEELSSLSKNLNELILDYNEILTKKTALDSDFVNYNNFNNQIISIRKQIESLVHRNLNPSKNELEQLLQKKVRYDKIAEFKILYPSLSEKKEKMMNDKLLFQEKTSILNEISQIENNISSLENDAFKMKADLDSCSNLVDEYNELASKLEEIRTVGEKERSSLQELEFNEKNLINEKNRLLQIKKKFDSLGSDAPCPSCERPLGEHYESKTSDLLNEISNIDSNIQNISVLKESKSKEINDLIAEFNRIKILYEKKSVEINNANSLQNNLKHILTNLNTLKENLENKKIQLEKVKDVQFDINEFNELNEKVQKSRVLYDEIISTENLISKIPSLEANIEEVEAEKIDLESQIIYLENEIKKIDFVESEYVEINNSLQNSHITIQNLRDEKTNLEIAINNKKKDVEYINQKLKENQLVLVEIHQKEKEASMHKKLEEFFKNYKIDTLKKIAPTLSGIMSEYIEIMTNGKYNQIELDKDYNIFIYRKDKKHPLSFYSGGEKKLAALCQRLAISGLLVSQNGQAKFDMIAMDEVFGAMDNERQDNIMEMLRNLNEKFSQIFIVTHSESVKESFDYLLEISHGKDGKSKFEYLTNVDLSETQEILENYILD